MKVLIVEDDYDISSNLSLFLKENNYQVDTASCLKEINLSNNYDALILDITLPDGNGLDYYEKEISKINLPTIFLTAKDDEETIVKSLELGADDYVTKPFHAKELLLRLNKIILHQEKNTIIKVKDITLDLDKMTVYKNNTEIKLTNLELKILLLLFTNLNKVVTREMIIDNIWQWTGNDVNDNTVTVYLKRIRAKLQTDIIVTLKGIGYRIDSDER